MTPLLAALLLSLQTTAPPAIMVAPVLPPDSKPTYRAQGPPACDDWRAAREGTAENSDLRSAIYGMWVLGYITGFNVVGPDPRGDLLGDAPREEAYTVVDGYCARHPSHSVVDAMGPLADAYIRQRQQGALTNSSPAGNKRRAMVVGAASCRDWVHDRSNAPVRLARVSMVRGYVTAYNRWGPDPTGDAIGANDHPLIEEALDNWCLENPAALLIGAVAPLIAHVSAERAAGRLPPGGMGPDETFSQGSPGDH